MLTEKLGIKVFTLNYFQKSDTNMRSYLCRGNGSHIWLFYVLASSIPHGNVSWLVVKMKGGVPWPISLCKLEAGSALADIERRARLDLWPRPVVWPNYCFEFKKAVSFMHRTMSVLKNIKKQRNECYNFITWKWKPETWISNRHWTLKKISIYIMKNSRKGLKIIYLQYICNTTRTNS